MAVQVSLENPVLSFWAQQYAQKASEIVRAAAHMPDAAQQVAGILLAPSDGWPQRAHAGATLVPGTFAAQQLALVNALSEWLPFDSVLRSSPWLAQEIVCVAQGNPAIQLLGTLQERVLETISSELGEDASRRIQPTVFDISAARCPQLKQSNCSNYVCNWELCCQYNAAGVGFTLPVAMMQPMEDGGGHAAS